MNQEFIIKQIECLRNLIEFEEERKYRAYNLILSLREIIKKSEKEIDDSVYHIDSHNKDIIQLERKLVELKNEKKTDI
jgi:hypothetical protein